jgi:methyl-accepting chemotaxis protein
MLNSIQARLSLALIPVIAFFIMLGTSVWLVSVSTSDDIGETVRRNTLVSAQVEDLSILAQQIRRYEKEYFIYVGDAEGRAKYRKEWSQTHRKMDDQIKVMSKNAQSLFSAQDVAELKKGSEALAFYAAEMNKIFKTADEKAFAVEDYIAPSAQQLQAAAKIGKELDPAPRMLTPAEANALIREGKDRLAAELIKPLANMGKVRQESTLSLPEISRAGFGQVAKFVVILAAVGVIVTVAVMLLLPRTIRAPLSTLTAQVDALSKGKSIEGDEEVQIKEFHGLAQAVTRMSRAQKMLLERVKRSSAAV